jgi:HEAT repeat protein
MPQNTTKPPRSRRNHRNSRTAGRSLIGLASTLVLVLLLAGCAASPAAREARTLLDAGKLTEAQHEIDRGLADHPDSEELLRLKIRVHVRQGEIAEVVAAYNGWAKREGQDRVLLRYIALKVLQWGLKHRDPAIRLAALHGARQTDAAPLEDEVKGRLKDPDEVVRSWAAVALSGTPRGAAVLERQLKSSVPGARSVAVANLGRIAGAGAIKALSGFVDDPAAEVRAALARGLPRTRSPKALPLLIKLAADKERSVRAAAVAGLADLGLKGGVPTVRTALKDPYRGVRISALLALADLEGEAAAGILADVAAGDDLAQALRAGIRLCRLGQVQPALNAIAKALVDRTWTVRAAACNAAGSVQDAVALKLVQRALRDQEPAVRLAAARAVIARSTPSNPDAVKVALGVTNLACTGDKGGAMEALCLQAAEILAGARRPVGQKTLARLALKGREAQTRIAALRMAIRALPQRATGLTLKVLPDKMAQVTVAAAVTLYKQVK